MEPKFILTRKTKIEMKAGFSVAVETFMEILKRDILQVVESELNQQPENKIQILLIDTSELANETFRLTFSCCAKVMVIEAKDELGAIYGLLHLSRNYLGIQPFWFWNQQVCKKYSQIEIPLLAYQSAPFKVPFRGWFINDEVLLLGWKAEPNDKKVWEAVFEALLRCGGNMVIPGTDQNSRLNRQLASDMGLWISHHHAEPLGANMFSRRYPEKKASYLQHANLFEQLWREAIKEQRDLKIIWNLGFRGQGDRAFWADDPTLTDSKSRGALITQIIAKQSELVHEFIQSPKCCTNLYGEVMELYQQGLIHIPEPIIKIWADSGYGKMVSRRQGTHNPRIPALPDELDKGPHGLYYHVTFYDLQASNHLTMLPNSPQFVAYELQKALNHGIDHFFMINCGNIKPHTYLLDLISQIWKSGTVDIKQHLTAVIAQQYSVQVVEICQLYEGYFQATLQYGQQADEKAGEQYYHYSIRKIVHHWVKGKTDEPAKNLIWLTGAICFGAQIQWLLEKTSSISSKWEHLFLQAIKVKEQLTDQEQENFSQTLLLQITLHLTGCKGLIHLCESYKEYCLGNEMQSFIWAKEGEKQIDKGLTAMKKAQQGKWEHFYRNDCLTNVELTVYCLETLGRYIRLVGDGPSFYQWEKDYLISESDKQVELITNFQKPLSDTELAKRLKIINKGGIKSWQI